MGEWEEVRGRQWRQKWGEAKVGEQGGRYGCGEVDSGGK